MQPASLTWIGTESELRAGASSCQLSAPAANRQDCRTDCDTLGRPAPLPWIGTPGVYAPASVREPVAKARRAATSAASQIEVRSVRESSQRQPTRRNH